MNDASALQQQMPSASKPPAMPPREDVRRVGPRLFDVYDSSATSKNPHRVHDIIVNGLVQQVKFQYGQPTQMPFTEAMKFQKEGFTVKDEKGNTIKRPTETVAENILQFGPDKVVADLGELTREALYIRAVTLPGGEDYNPSSAKDDLISFLIACAKSKVAAAVPTGALEGGIEEADEDDLDKLGLKAE